MTALGDAQAAEAAARLRAPHVTTSLPAVPRTSGLVRGVVLAFAAAQGAGPELLGDIAIAVGEAVNNVVLHAYDGPGEVHVTADVEDGDLEIVVRDDGRGFGTGASAGLGVGLNLMAEVTSAFEIRSRAPLDGIEVRMRFGLRG